jgi:hypothetical protein
MSPLAWLPRLLLLLLLTSKVSGNSVSTLPTLILESHESRVRQAQARHMWRSQVSGGLPTPAPTSSALTLQLSCDNGGTLEGKCCCGVASHTYDVLSRTGLLGNITYLSWYTNTGYYVDCASQTTLKVSNDLQSWRQLLVFPSRGRAGNTQTVHYIGVWRYLRMWTNNCDIDASNITFRVVPLATSGEIF